MVAPVTGPPPEVRPWAVVVAWRADASTGSSLDHLLGVAPGVAVALVDNESRPAGLAAALAGRATVTALPQGENRGFAGGANAGLEHAFGAGATHVLLLNDDVRPEPGCVEALVAAAGDDGAAAPLIDAPGGEAFAGGRIDWTRGLAGHHAGALDYLTGAALCISRSAWSRVGRFDEGCFLYYEDVDWCVRARDRGVPLRLAEAHAHHAAGSSTGGAAGPTWGYYDTRNHLRFLEARRGRVAARREAVRTLRDVARLRREGGPSAVTVAQLRGVLDWWRGRDGRGPYPPRAT